jgi:hypothetical protein
MKNSKTLVDIFLGKQLRMQNALARIAEIAR